MNHPKKELLKDKLEELYNDMIIFIAKLCKDTIILIVKAITAATVSTSTVLIPKLSFAFIKYVNKKLKENKKEKPSCKSPEEMV